MINLFILDRDLNKIALLDTFNSLIWVRRYSTTGDFKLTLPYDNSLQDYIKRDYFILHPVNNEVAIIETINIKTEGQNSVIEITGRFIYALTERRINNAIKNFNNMPVGAVVSSLFNDNCTGGTNRGISILKPIQSTTGANITIQDSYSNILDKTTDLLKTYNLGIKGELIEAEKKINFTIYQGRDLTSTLIFSPKFENVTNEEYFYNSANLKTWALIGGEGEGSQRITATTGTGTGLDLREVFIDGRDIRKESLTAEQYTNALIGRGKEKLSDMVEVNTFNSGVSTESNIKYRYDYNLGDKVTYLSEILGIKDTLTIEEIEEVYENGREIININFGDSIPTLSTLIKNMIGGK